MALKEMTIAMAMVIEDCDVVTMAVMLEMSGAMMMYVHDDGAEGDDDSDGNGD